MLAEQSLLMHLEQQKASIRMLEHTSCRTSAESASARASAGAPDAIGAKALVVVASDEYNMIVLPGMRRLDSKRVRSMIGKFRFASPDEVREATGGLEIGTIPPFGKPVFPKISKLIVDIRIVECNLIGFNAACLTRSAVMPGSVWKDTARPDQIDDISLPSEAEQVSND